MSLAYKLWNIGKIVENKEIEDSIRVRLDDSEKDKKNTVNDEVKFLTIDFRFDNKDLVEVQINLDSIEEEKLFFTKKVGGSGSGIFYLYPCLKLLKEEPAKKYNLLLNTLKKSIVELCDKNNKSYEYLDLLLNHDDKPLENQAEQLSEYKKGNYIFVLSINGKTFYELFPEVWQSWLKNSAEKNDYAKKGYDVFLNKEMEVGYKPDIKVFSLDNYHDSLKYRINDNLALSQESANFIKFAWIFILKNLVFYYKGLQYIILPNVLTGKAEHLKIIIERLKVACHKTNSSKSALETLQREEETIKKQITKAQTKEHKSQLKEITTKIEDYNHGYIEEIHNQINEFGDLKNSVTLDIIFTDIDRKNLSFKILGSLSDVIPSRISRVVNTMRDLKIKDSLSLKNKDYNYTYLHDFFNRDEMHFSLARASDKNKNKIFQERLYLARLLLTDVQISMDDLLRRFEINREHSYEYKKRVVEDKNGIKVKEWLLFPDSFIQKEESILKFLTQLKKIKGGKIDD